MESNSPRSDDPLVSGDGKYVWNGQRWIPTAPRSRPFDLDHHPDTPHPGAGFLLPTWPLMLMGVLIGLGVLWLLGPGFYFGW